MYTDVNSIVTIPVTAPIQNFKYQLSFFEFCHKKVYEDKAEKKCLIPILDRNRRQDDKITSIDWDITLPYQIIDSIYDYSDLDDTQIVVCNEFYAAKMLLDNFDEDQVLEVQDCDIVHLRPYTGPLPEHNQVIVDITYENWHMHIGSENAKNSNIIKPYLKKQDKWYPNGGFNTIVRAGTLRRIVDDIIDISLQITQDHTRTPHAWWAQMYGLNVACHNNQVEMIGVNNTYYPNINDLNLGIHHQTHYSVDPLFNKRRLPNINPHRLPNNKFYNLAKQWLTSTQF